MKVVFQGSGHYPTGAIIGPACWAHWDLLIVTRGRISMQSGRRRFGPRVTMDEGSAVLLPPGTRFCGQGQTPQTTIWVVHFEEEMPRSKNARYFHQAAGDAFSRGLLTEIADVYRSSTDNIKNPYMSALVRALVKKIWQAGKLGSGTNPVDARIKLCRVEDLELRRGFPFPNAADLAKAAGLSESHHRVLFRKQFGLSPGRHLLQMRIIYARKLLCETQYPIKHIASFCGYKDVVSFHRAFSEICGITPGHFRMHQQQGPV